LKKAGMLVVSILVLVFCLLEVVHLTRFGHFLPIGPHADVLVTNADFGIPGISKVYRAKLTNFGIVPVKITVCDYIDDGMRHRTQVGWAVEKWDTLTKRWRNVFENVDNLRWCQPSPLSIVDGHIVTKRLWLGQSVEGGEGAIAASDVFAIGDNARFVVFQGNGRFFRTASFSIDEHRTFQ
jgi:hypothetical protein